MVGHVQRLFDGGIAATDHRHLLAAKEEAVAGRARADPLALHRLLAVDPQPFRLRAGGDDQHLALVHVATVAGQAEGPLRQVDADDCVPHHRRADMLGLGLHLLHQPRPLDDVGEARIILDIGRGGQLSARLDALHDDRLHPRPRAIDRRRQPGRAGTENQHAGGVRGHGHDLGYGCVLFHGTVAAARRWRRHDGKGGDRALYGAGGRLGLDEGAGADRDCRARRAGDGRGTRAPEQGGRLSMRVLRLGQARTSASCGVLRERRQGDRMGADPLSHHARFLRQAHADRACRVARSRPRAGGPADPPDALRCRHRPLCRGRLGRGVRRHRRAV